MTVSSGRGGRTFWRTPVFELAGAASCASTVMLGITWHPVATVASGIGLLVLGLLLVTCAARWLLVPTPQTRHRSESAEHAGTTPIEANSSRSVAVRFPRQIAWVGRRLDSSCPRGLALTLVLAVAATAAWTFAGLTHDVIAHEGLASADATVHAWVLGHRTGWLDLAMRTGTWAGSNLVLLPVLVVSVALLRRSRHSWLPGLQVALTYGAAVLCHILVTAAVQRPRPPEAGWLASATGSSYPSGHTMQITALCGAMIIVLGPHASRLFRIAATGVAVTLVLVVGTSRVYLGVHWLTDVLGGLTLSIALVCLVPPPPTSC